MAISEPICVPRLSQIETELAGANMSQNFFAHE